MRKKLIKAAILSSFILVLGGASYASDVGTTAANFLKIGIGARATAMGGAFTGLADDATALYWNPAGLTQIEGREFSATYSSWFPGINRGYITYVMPKLGGVTAVGFNYVSAGVIEGRDEEGTPTGNFGAVNTNLSLGYAHKISNNAMLGASIGQVQLSIDGHARSAWIASVGFLIRNLRSFSLGLSFQNIGLKMGEDSLPSTVRAGIAKQWNALTFALDVVKTIDDAEPYYCAGLEWWLVDFSALRLGYTTGQDTGAGITAGLGFNYNDLNLDYAYVPYGDLGSTHRFSVGADL